MKLPNWFKIVWWVVLLAASSIYLAGRYTSIQDGAPTTIDAIVLLFWIALVLAPIFAEISFLGLSVKQRIDQVRAELKEQVINLRSEVQSAVSVSTTLNQQLVLQPPEDRDLPDLRDHVREVIESTLRAQGLAPRDTPAELSVGTDATYLFEVRFHLEKELRRLGETLLDLKEGRRATPVLKVARDLADAGLVPPGLAGVVREIYSVCSPAIHGQVVSPAQVAFVRDVAPDLIEALRRLR